MKDKDLNRIGVFCGTFNPIHIGHLLIAECARDQFKLEKVLFITSATPPHRQEGLLAAEDRHELVTAAVASNSHFEASDLELKRNGPSYTVETLRELKNRFGTQVELYLIIGGDNSEYINEWHEAEELFKLAHILIAPRVLDDIKSPPTKSNISRTDNRSAIDSPAIAVSSSLIRQRIAENKSVLYMVPSEVNAIIKKKHHFRRIASP